MAIGIAHHKSIGLPGHYYNDSAIFDKEMKTLWRSTWQMVGRLEDLPSPGDYLTCVLGEEPIFIIRMIDGTLRAMHNVCPHRGARLLDGQGNCSLLRCPYHAWIFNLEGHLLRVPQQHLFPDLDKLTIKLIPAQVDIWRGFIFVNPDLEGESLIDYLADFPSFLMRYEYTYEDLREVLHLSYTEPINWKFLVENYVEDYHFAIVHPETLKVFDFPNIQTIPTGRHCQVYLPYVYEKPLGDCKYPWESAGGSYQGYIFPNMMINTAKNHVSIFRIKPLAPTCTCIEIFIYQSPEQMEEFPLDLEALRASCDRDMEEDFVICRLLQGGVNSRAYQVAQLANNHELGVAHFHKVLTKYL